MYPSHRSHIPHFQGLLLTMHTNWQVNFCNAFYQNRLYDSSDIIDKLDFSAVPDALFSSSQKQTYIPVFPLTSIGRNNPAFIFCTSNILRNASGIIESAEIIYGFPLKNGSSSFEMFCDASIRDSLPAEQYSLIMLTVVPSIFSRNKTAAEIPRYSHASFKIS